MWIHYVNVCVCVSVKFRLSYLFVISAEFTGSKRYFHIGFAVL